MKPLLLTALVLGLLSVPLPVKAGGTSGPGVIADVARIVDLDLVFADELDFVFALVTTAPSAGTVTHGVYRQEVSSWVHASSTLALDGNPDADIVAFGESIWILYVRSSSLVGLREMHGDGTWEGETFPFLDLPAGVEVEEVELDATATGLRALIGLSDGTLRYLQTSGEIPLALVETVGLNDGRPLFDRGLSWTASTSSNILTYGRGYYSYVSRDEEIFTGSIFYNLFLGETRASDVSPSPTPLADSSVFRTTIAAVGDQVLAAHEVVEPGGDHGGLGVGVRKGGVWRDVRTEALGRSTHHGMADAAFDGFMVLHPDLRVTGPSDLVVTAVSPGGAVEVQRRLPVGDLGARTELALVVHAGHRASTAWIDGEPGSLGTAARYAYFDLAPLYIFADGFESGDLSRWGQ